MTARILSGIIFINRNGLRWYDAPKEYGPAKTLNNRWKRWSDNGVFARSMVRLATERAEHKTIMIDATYLADWRKSLASSESSSIMHAILDCIPRCCKLLQGAFRMGLGPGGSAFRLARMPVPRGEGRAILLEARRLTTLDQRSDNHRLDRIQPARPASLG